MIAQRGGHLQVVACAGAGKTEATSLSISAVRMVAIDDGEQGTGQSGRSSPTEGDRVRYWWVNQNQTYRAEVSGGYLWSPKRNKNGARSQFYENMREVAPGDLVFSFRDTKIKAVGVCRS